MSLSLPDSKMETLHKKVQKSIEHIRPFLVEDGGDVELVEITNDLTARVKFVGACTTCNMANMTFKAGVQEVILQEVPEIKKVEAIIPEVINN